MFIINYHHTTDALKQLISIIKQDFILSNLWSKEVIVNVSYPITVNKIDGYMYAIILLKSVRYIISIYRVYIEVH